MKTYHARITRLTVLPLGSPIFSERATNISIVDEAAGEFLEIEQINDNSEIGRIRLDGAEEWTLIAAAVETLIAEIKANESSDCDTIARTPEPDDCEPAYPSATP